LFIDLLNDDVLDYKVWNENRMIRNCILICRKPAFISLYIHRPMPETILVSIKACVSVISTPICVDRKFIKCLVYTLELQVSNLR
jgi:hypothetical protein